MYAIRSYYDALRAAVNLQEERERLPRNQLGEVRAQGPVREVVLPLVQVPAVLGPGEHLELLHQVDRLRQAHVPEALLALAHAVEPEHGNRGFLQHVLDERRAAEAPAEMSVRGHDGGRTRHERGRESYNFV